MRKHKKYMWLYQNKYNPNKFIELKLYHDGHYYWHQYLVWENTTTHARIVNHVGGNTFHRVSVHTWKPVLTQDYNLIGIDWL